VGFVGTPKQQRIFRGSSTLVNDRDRITEPIGDAY
jgi:hypothetical protein